MLITTTPTLQNQDIETYLGIVSGEAIIGANVFKDFFASITDIIGGRSGSYERSLKKAQQIALEELERRADEMGANAIVGVDIDYETIGEKSSMLMVTASGTAVRLR
jgi:uncharacterized protein YbjQ (UPF0145 family)